MHRHISSGRIVAPTLAGISLWLVSYQRLGIGKFPLPRRKVVGRSRNILRRGIETFCFGLDNGGFPRRCSPGKSLEAKTANSSVRSVMRKRICLDQSGTECDCETR